MHFWETLSFNKIPRGACPCTPAYSQGSALLLQKLMKTLPLVQVDASIKRTKPTIQISLSMDLAFL